MYCHYTRKEFKVDSNLIIKILHSYKISYLLFYAAEHKIFDYLLEPITAQEVCSKLKISSSKKMEIILNIFSGYQILNKCNNKYCLKEEFLNLLCSESKESILYLINLEKYLMQNHNCYDQFVVSLESDVQDDFNNQGKENMESTYGQAMQNGGRLAALQVGRIFRCIQKMSPKILDIGGGIGSYSISIVKCRPDAKVDIYERQEMRELGIKNIESEKLSDSISYHIVDIIKDEIHKKYDGILISNVLHLYQPDVIEVMLRKVTKCLEDDGVLVIHDFFLNENHIEPLVPLLFTIDWLMLGAEFNYSPKDMEQMAKQCGLKLTEIKRFQELPTSILIFEKD